MIVRKDIPAKPGFEVLEDPETGLIVQIPDIAQRKQFPELWNGHYKGPGEKERDTLLVLSLFIVFGAVTLIAILRAF